MVVTIDGSVIPLPSSYDETLLQIRDILTYKSEDYVVLGRGHEILNNKSVLFNIIVQKRADIEKIFNEQQNKEQQVKEEIKEETKSE